MARKRTLAEELAELSTTAPTKGDDSQKAQLLSCACPSVLHLHQQPGSLSLLGHFVPAEHDPEAGLLIDEPILEASDEELDARPAR